MASQQSKKSRKHDRNKDWCKAYAASRKQERHTIRGLLRHLARHAQTDGAAIERLRALQLDATKEQGAQITVALDAFKAQPAVDLRTHRKRQRERHPGHSEQMRREGVRPAIRSAA